VFHDALETKSFNCYLREDTRLPMMFIDDCLHSVLQFMQFPADQLKQRTYNITAMSFTPAELFAEIKKHIPELKVTYSVDSRQAIGNFNENLANLLIS
jgi:threonine 3-dehydrogenase